ncbi:MAG: AI-2E family transporter [Gammaproteobacteria bacterium]
MLDLLLAWYRRYLSDPQAVLLLVLLIVGFTIIITMGHMLAPVLAAVVIAYLLESLVQVLRRRGMRRFMAVILVWLLFVAFMVFMMVGIIPSLSAQVAQFIPEVANYWSQAEKFLYTLPNKYSFISHAQIKIITHDLTEFISVGGKKILASASLQFITTGAVTVIIYLILLPLMVFFFLKDKWIILNWLGGFLPRDRHLATQVWTEMDRQLGNYVRGKVWEILIVGVVSYVVFALFGLKYAFLLGVVNGLSVIIPYVGATLVTIPIAAVAFFQWGWSADFAWLFISYLVIQALDGNVLVPYLFGNVVNLHPVAIIISILVFSGLWGFWGVFFAIPLATLVNALLRAWPRSDNGQDKNSDADHKVSEA